jgi:hypothetical protein
MAVEERVCQCVSGYGERERSSTRARVWRRQGGDTDAATVALDLGIVSCGCGLRERTREGD